jgi:hypothetical protein
MALLSGGVLLRLRRSEMLRMGLLVRAQSLLVLAMVLLSMVVSALLGLRALTTSVYLI